MDEFEFAIDEDDFGIEYDEPCDWHAEMVLAYYD
jgi:hypothetical protein